jgi:hypothetical protein
MRSASSATLDVAMKTATWASAVRSNTTRLSDTARSPALERSIVG